MPNKPYYIKSSDGKFTLYNFDFKKEGPDSIFSPHSSVAGMPTVIGEYQTEEEMQAASMRLFGEGAKNTSGEA